MSLVYRIVSRERVTLFEAARQWTPRERTRYKRMLQRLYDKVLDVLLQGSGVDGQFVSKFGRSRMTAHVVFEAPKVTISILRVEFDGPDGGGSGPGGGLDALAFEDHTIVTTAELTREGRHWRFDQRSGDPIRWPGTRNRLTRLRARSMRELRDESHSSLGTITSFIIKERTQNASFENNEVEICVSYSSTVLVDWSGISTQSHWVEKETFKISLLEEEPSSNYNNYIIAAGINASDNCRCLPLQ